MSNKAQTVEERDMPNPPDLRQSLCHTLLAMGFFMLYKLGPSAGGDSDTSFYLGIVLALVFVALFSWYSFGRRLKTWRRVPSSVRSRFTRRPTELKQRAITHLLISLLALTLTALAFSPYALRSDFEGLSAMDITMIICGAIIGIVSVAILSRTVRDLLAVRRFNQQQ